MVNENWHERYKAMLKDLNWTHKDVAKMIGISYDLERKEMQTSSPFPRRAKLAVLAYEKMKRRYDLRESIVAEVMNNGIKYINQALNAVVEFKNSK